MKICISFDDTAVKQHGYTKEGVCNTLKQEFRKRNLPCISEGDVLTFTSTGQEDDYSNILLMILAMSRTEWFLDIAASCIFYDDEGHTENILAQARQQRKKAAEKNVL